MKKSGFFNSAQGTTDRAYQAIDFALPLGALAGGKGGIVMGVGDDFKVKWTAGGSFTLGSGFAFLGEMPGWWYYSDEEMTITLDNAATPSEPCFVHSNESEQERVNILAIKMDAETDRQAELVVLAGELVDGTYQMPDIVNSNGYNEYYVPIAKVKTDMNGITKVVDMRVSVSGKNCLAVEKDASGNPKVRAGYCGIQQLKDEDTDDDQLADVFKGEWKESYYGIGISDGKQLITQGLCNIEDDAEFPEGLEWPVTYYVQEDGKMGLTPTKKVAGFTLNRSLLLVNLQGPFGQNDEYDGEMINFNAIPGETGKVRFKIHLPEGANGVKLKYKRTPWLNGDTMAETGTEIADLDTDAGYYGTNNWYEVTIPVDGTENPETVANGTKIYVKAFPYASSANEKHVTDDPNEVAVTVGTLINEWTADGSASTPSVGSNGLTLNNIATQGALVGSGFVNYGSDAYAIPSSGIDLGGKTLTFSMKHTGATSSLFGHGAVYHIYGRIASGALNIGSRDPSGYYHTYNVISSTQYHNIAVVVNNLNVSVYIDGALANSVVMPSITTTTINRIGMCNLGASSNSFEYLNATMDQIRIFNGQLTPDDIKNLHNGGNGC